MSGVSKMRADVIDRAIRIEWLISMIICQHYFQRIPKHFLLEVLFDDTFGFALKHRVLMKIAPALKRPINEKLHRLSTIRNYFAHLGGIGISSTARPGQPPRIPDPRNPSRSVDFPALHDEFVKLEEPLRKTLQAHLRSIGGTLVPKLS